MGHIGRVGAGGRRVRIGWLPHPPRHVSAYGPRIFGLTNDANLKLISCIGDFDPANASYDKRIVVYTCLNPSSR